MTRRKPKRNRKGNAAESQGNDQCQTPAEIAIPPLLPFIRPEWTIWESAAGEGNIVAYLRSKGRTVVASDVLTGQNFFHYEPDQWDVLVTNPPYTIKYKWLARCYQLGKPFALLVPVDTLGAGTAQKLFDQYGVQNIFMHPRINFKMPNKGWDGSSAQFSTYWCTWGLNLPKENNYVDLTKINQPMLF